MSSYLSAKQDKGFSRFPLMMKGIAAFGFSALVVLSVQETSTNRSGVYPFFQSNQTSVNAPDLRVHKTSAFFEELKSRYPSTFRMDANGTAQLAIAAQSFYTCTSKGSQEVITSKGWMKEQVVFRLNQEHISYNVTEGLGIWTIQWSDELFLPTL